MGVKGGQTDSGPSWLRATEFKKKGGTTVKTRFLLSFVWLAALALFSAPAYSAGEVQYIIENDYTGMTPIFMPGHAGDPAWIEGFVVTGDIFYNGAKVGTAKGDIWLWNPPMVLGEAYSQVGMVFTHTITALGGSTFEVHAQGVVLGSSTSASSGDISGAWSGSVANGTGFFANKYGVSAGAFTANNFTATGSGTQIVLVRSGF